MKNVVLIGILVLGGTVCLATSPAGSAPSFGAPKSYPTGNAPVSVAIGDLNGDGKLDVATAEEGHEAVSVLLNMGDGTLQPHVDYDTGSLPESVAIGDLNGDGKADLATANRFASSVSIFLNRGDG